MHCCISPETSTPRGLCRSSCPVPRSICARRLLCDAPDCSLCAALLCAALLSSGGGMLRSTAGGTSSGPPRVLLLGADGWGVEEPGRHIATAASGLRPREHSSCRHLRTRWHILRTTYAVGGDTNARAKGWWAMINAATGMEWWTGPRINEVGASPARSARRGQNPSSHVPNRSCADD